MLSLFDRRLLPSRRSLSDPLRRGYVWGPAWPDLRSQLRGRAGGQRLLCRRDGTIALRCWHHRSRGGRRGLQPLRRGHVPRQQGRHYVRRLHAGWLLRVWRGGTDVVRGGQLLKHFRQHRPSRLRCLSGRHGMCSGLVGACAMRCWLVHRRGGRGPVHTVRGRHLPGSLGADGMRGLHARWLLPVGCGRSHSLRGWLLLRHVRQCGSVGLHRLSRWLRLLGRID